MLDTVKCQDNLQMALFIWSLSCLVLITMHCNYCIISTSIIMPLLYTAKHSNTKFVHFILELKIFQEKINVVSI